MFKQVWIWAACLLTGPLTAEIIGDIEVQFPPSNYEWKQLINLSDIDFYDDEFDEEEESDPAVYSWYTHREGDALELLMSMQTQHNEDDEDEADSLETAQRIVDAALNQFLPNHKFTFTHFDNRGINEGFVAFELTDGVEVLLHGLTRAWVDSNGERSVAFVYLTTARKSERNELVWTEVLNQARFVN